PNHPRELAGVVACDAVCADCAVPWRRSAEDRGIHSVPRGQTTGERTPPMPDCVRVAIIDSHPIFRKGLIDTMSSDGLTVVAEGDTVDDAMSIVSAGNVDILFLGL